MSVRYLFSFAMAGIKNVVAGKKNDCIQIYSKGQSIFLIMGTFLRVKSLHLEI
jgi:hypothetical protein